MEDIRFDGKLDLTIDDIGFISVLRESGYSFAFPSGKKKYSLVYAESGELEYNFFGMEKVCKIEQGNLLFVPKNLPYKTTYLKKDTLIKAITFDIISDGVPAIFSSPIIKSSKEIASIFSSITNKNMRNSIFLSSKIYELIYILQNDFRTVPKKYRKILPALAEIEQKYFENEKISHYADMCEMSESNFRKLFREYTGKSPIEYRNLIRIAEAKKMIDSGEFSVAEAAYLTGFNNMSFFYDVLGRKNV